MVGQKGPPVTIYVEGGGTTDGERARLREGLSKFLSTIPKRKSPRIVACGGRAEAYRNFTKHDDESLAVLLVDSEEPVTVGSPWEHVRLRAGDGWVQPTSAVDDQLQLMTVMTETWLIADIDNLKARWRKLDASKLPTASLENCSKESLRRSLQQAMWETASGELSKADVFDLLATTRPTEVQKHCPKWGARFIALIQSRC